MAYVEGEIPLNTGNNATLAYPVMPYMPYGFGGGNGFGNDWSWIIILFLIAGAWGGNGFGGGFGGGNNMLYDINANTNRGFDNLSINNGIDALQTAVTTGFANGEVARCNSTTALLQAINGVGSDAKFGIADLKYTVATENCADRQALSEGVRDIIASNTANTQAILDKLCQQEIDAKNDLIATLRSQVSMADLKASQTAQTAQILAGQINEIDALYNRLSNCPVPSTPVYGRQPIFTCGGCGCQNVQ